MNNLVFKERGIGLKLSPRQEEIINLVKENQNLFEAYKNLKLDLHKELTKNIKLNKVLEQLIIAICYSEDEKLLKTCSKIFKDLRE